MELVEVVIEGEEEEEVEEVEGVVLKCFRSGGVVPILERTLGECVVSDGEWLIWEEPVRQCDKILVYTSINYDRMSFCCNTILYVSHDITW